MQSILDIYNQINNFGNINGMIFKVIKPGIIEYRMQVKKEHLATLEVTHGGVIAAFMDAVLGVASLSLSSEKGQLISTVEFKINFLKPVKLNDHLLGKGTVESQGKSIYIASGEIINEDNGEVVAKGLGTFKSYPIEKTELNEKFK